MNEIRLGVIGCGGIAQHHMSYFDKLPGLQFTAASDISANTLKAVADKHKVQTFLDGMDLIQSGLVDAVLICTPHYSHPTFALAAFQQGLHVLCEKPVAVTAKAAQQINAAHAQHRNLVFSVMFMMRVNPVWSKVKALLDDGAVGKITRVNWIASNWFRSQAYYDSGTWRATWAGEGGGVLLNQCPHILDLLTWLCGMPNKVTAQVGIGKHHKIEVEDEVNAILEYPNGAVGMFCTTTAECPGTNRLEIAGDAGRIITDGAKTIEWTQNAVATSKFSKTTDERFGQPAMHKYTVEPGGADLGHMGLTRNFLAAIRDRKTKLIVPGAEGINSLELGNAMLMSGLLGKPVAIPTDRNAYERLLQKLIKTSTFKKGASKKAGGDMAASFK